MSKGVIYQLRTDLDTAIEGWGQPLCEYLVAICYYSAESRLYCGIGMLPTAQCTGYIRRQV